MLRSDELGLLIRFGKRIGVTYHELRALTGYGSATVQRWGEGFLPRDPEGINEAVKKRLAKHINEILKEAKELDIDLGHD